VGVLLSVFMSVMASDDEDLGYQIAVELRPTANAREIANTLGFDYEGNIPSLPNIHLFRLKQENRKRETHSRAVETLKSHPHVVFSEIQVPRERVKRSAVEYEGQPL